MPNIYLASVWITNNSGSFRLNKRLNQSVRSEMFVLISSDGRKVVSETFENDPDAYQDIFKLSLEYGTP